MGKTKQFLFMIDDDEREMIEKLGKKVDRPMSWVLRRLIRKAHATVFEANIDGDPIVEAGLR